MPLPTHKTAGEKFDFPAEMFNELVALLQEPSRRLPGGPQHFTPHWPRLTVAIYNDTGTDVLRGEILPISGWQYTLAENFEATGRGVMAADSADAPPGYSTWGVAVEPIPDGKVGQVAVAGIVLARIEYHSGQWTSSNDLQYADIHPDPDPDPDLREAWRLVPRMHGRARILDAGDYEADGETQHYALIDLDRPNWLVPIQAKASITVRPASDTFTAYVSHTTYYLDPAEEIDVEITDPTRAASFRAMGKDDVTTGPGTLGWARWDGTRFVLVDWPTGWLVQLQAEFDDHPFDSTNTISVKFYDGSNAVGTAFNVQLGYPSGTHGSTPGENPHTAHAEVDTLLELIAVADKAVIDASPLLDAPYGTIRAYAYLGISDRLDDPGPHHGWYWCDGTNGTPDLRDRFLVGWGDDHTIDTTGGQSLHGGGVNDHDDHDLGSLSTVNVASGSGETVLDGSENLTHTETDNEPPWYAVAFAQRRAAV